MYTYIYMYACIKLKSSIRYDQKKCPWKVTTGESGACWDGRWGTRPPRRRFHTALRVGTVTPPGSPPDT